MNSRNSCGPECTKRNPTCENCALPPDSCLGAFSTMMMEPAPARFAAMAASSAALPPPTTMTSQVCLEFMMDDFCSIALRDGELFVGWVEPLRNPSTTSRNLSFLRPVGLMGFGKSREERALPLPILQPTLLA